MLKHLLQHSMIHAAGRVIGLGISVVSMGLLARYLGQEQFGWYIIAFTWLQFFSIAVDFGLYMIGLKLLGEAGTKAREQKVFSQLFWLRLFSAIIFVLIAPNIVWLMPYSIGIKLGVTVLAFSFFFANINQLLVVSFQKTVRMQTVAIAEVFGKITALISLYIVILFDFGFAAALASIAFFGLLQSVVLFLKLTPEHYISWHWDSALVKKILIQTAPLGIIIILNTLYFKADTLILSWFVPAGEVGLYGAPYKILEILVSFPAMYLGLLLPHVAQWYKKRQYKTLRAYAEQSFRIMSLLIAVMIPLTIVFADDIMVLVAGRDFAASGLWLRYLIIAAASIFYGQLFGYILVGIGRQKVQMVIYAAVAAIALMLYSVFIPLAGVVAAAIITIVVEVTATVALGIQAVKFLRWNIQVIPIIILTLIAIGVGVFAWLMQPYGPWWVIFLLSCAVYLVLILLFRIVTIQQIQTLIKRA
ncbi:MAG: flippase [Patescibacteria group bacterium]